jgi:hypothetical protein
MSEKTSVSERVLMAASFEDPSLIHDRVAGASTGLMLKVEVSFAAYNVPAERSLALSAMYMKYPAFVESSPLSTVRSSGRTTPSS